MTSGVKKPLFSGLIERLRSLREQEALSHNQLSALASLSDNTTWRIEVKSNEPRIDTVERLACALGVSSTWLAFGYDGFEAWRERVPRKGEVERSAPTPKPGDHLCSESFRGIPDRMRMAREQSGVSMRAIARATDLSAQTVALIESGRSVPLISNIEAIAKALSVSPGWLAFGEVDEGE